MLNFNYVNPCTIDSSRPPPWARINDSTARSFNAVGLYGSGRYAVTLIYFDTTADGSSTITLATTTVFAITLSSGM